MTLIFDQNTYCYLLTEVVPLPIETQEEYERILKLVEKLTFQKNRTNIVAFFLTQRDAEESAEVRRVF